MQQQRQHQQREKARLQREREREKKARQLQQEQQKWDQERQQHQRQPYGFGGGCRNLALHVSERDRPPARQAIADCSAGCMTNKICPLGCPIGRSSRSSICSLQVDVCSGEVPSSPALRVACRMTARCFAV